MGEGRVDSLTLSTGLWQQEKDIQNEQQLLSLARVLNLLTISGQVNEHSLHFVICNLASVSFELKPLLQRIVGKCVGKVNQLITRVVRQQSTFVNDSLLALHKKYSP